MKNQITSRQIFLYLFTSIRFLLLISSANADNIDTQKPDTSSIEGKWDLTINISGKMSPSWLEVAHSGLNTLVGYFVGTGGSARPISKVTFPNGNNYNCTAVRAPSLHRNKPPVWGKPVRLFDGKDTKGWHMSGEINQWVVENGILKSPKPGSNIITDASFTDFKLHIEFRYPENGNSGVYLRGRYEVQVLDDKATEPWRAGIGSIYGFLTPSEVIAAKKPGVWQTYDITLVGRTVTVVANGKTIICNQLIPGITGGALNSNEGEPGPLMLQGDHEPIEYRNIIITPAK